MKIPYEAPKIADERSLEVDALACNKTPNVGSPCGQVFNGSTGNRDGCDVNSNARSS